MKTIKQIASELQQAEQNLKKAHSPYSYDDVHSDVEALRKALLKAITAKTTIDELADILQAKADDRLVVLPCKVGDTVYAIFNNKIHRCKIKEIQLSDFPTWNEGKHSATLYSYEDCRKHNVLWLSNAINKTVFLTREEAEKALKERDNNV